MLNLTEIGQSQSQSQSADPLFAGYGPLTEGQFDEAFDSSGAPCDHWKSFFDWLAAAGAEGYLDAAHDLARLRTESGIAFTADASRSNRVEDALPVILSAADWAELEAGIEQRARLADAAVSDIYSDRRAVAAGLIPPGLVYGGPAFAAHCAGWERPPRHFVHIYEADVARTADGSWIMLADRLDAPLGDGFLLANRIATTQAYADLFVEMGVRRIASHYAAFQEHLDLLMGWDGRLALLTGGEKDPRFFSHAYFARYLNASLVEPSDLTVREGSAFVKTLDGLKRVDVLLRGVPDASIDALHRPGRAAFGAPALSLAARSGSLKIANAIGSAAFAYRALAPYAHRLAHHLLGEELKLPDSPCLWMGGERAREQVLSERDRWRIEPLTTDRDHPDDSNFPTDDMDGAARQLARVGERYCAVQTPRLSNTPSWTSTGIKPVQWMMRVFASRTADGWSVAPSGVASVMQDDGRPRALDFGKDVWVLPDPQRARATQSAGMLKEKLARGYLRRTGLDLLSRVADELFWLGRNTERVEGVLRVLGVCLDRYLGGNRTDADPAVLTALVEIHADPNPNLKVGARYHDAFQRLARGDDEPASIPATLQVLRSGALRARSSISAESWRSIERLCSDRRWRATGPVRQNAAMASLIEDSVQALAAFAGSAQENLTRNFAWRFLEMGRRIERGVQIATLAEQLAGETRETDETYLRAWLTLSDSTAAYRARYMMTAQATAVIDLLVLDETNPRSLAFQLVALERVLGELPSDVPYRRPEHRRALALLTDLRLSDADQLAELDENGRRAGLNALMERCSEELAEVSNLLTRSYFAHADTPEALVSQARILTDDEDPAT